MIVLKELNNICLCRIPYLMSASSQHCGKFSLSYLPRRTVKHEYMTVTADGIRYRGQMFTHLNSLIKWFKEHFREPVQTAMGKIFFK